MKYPDPTVEAPVEPVEESRRLRAAQDEVPHLLRFQEFYRGLEDKRGIYYMFFTSGLLHWVAHAERHVPRETNLVLVGSALTDGEREWLAANLDRPFHHIELPVDDVTVWEFLFATNENDFGWLDIDCYVLDPRLFDEMSDVGERTSMNCTWSWDSELGFRVANTHFLYLNVRALRAVAALGVTPNPSPFDWVSTHRPFRPRECFMRVPTERERELLLQVLPPDEQGRPQLAGTYFNTLVVYQLLARAAGYPVHPVRGLARRFSSPHDAEDTNPEHWPEDMSDELFHLFGVSYYTNNCHHPGIRALYLAAEHVMLKNAAGLALPAGYADRHREITAELGGLGLAPVQARELFRRHLVAARRISEAAADRVLTLAPRPAPVIAD